MANIKFSAFTNEAVDAATTQLVGYKVGDTSANYRYSIAQLATALSPSISTFYTADGTIGTTRKALITDTIQFRNAGDTSDVLSLNTNGNVEISGNTGMGVAVDTGVTLKVDASGPNDQMAIIAKGRDQAAGDYSLICQDSAATNLFIVENDGLVTVGKNLKITGQGYTELNDIGTVATATWDIDWNNSNIQSITLNNGGAMTLNTPTNPKTGATYILKLIQGASPSTITWTASIFKWPAATAPVLSTSAGQVDIVTLIYDGTNYYGTSTINLS